jgi:hypothetical protein
MSSAGDEDSLAQKSKFSDANVDMMRQMTLDTKDQEDREILAKVDEQIGLAEKRRAAIDDIKRRDREAAAAAIST